MLFAKPVLPSCKFKSSIRIIFWKQQINFGMFSAFVICDSVIVFPIDMESPATPMFRVKKLRNLIFCQMNCLSICFNHRTQHVCWYQKRIRMLLKLMPISKENTSFVSTHWMDPAILIVWYQLAVFSRFIGKFCKIIKSKSGRIGMQNIFI